MATGAELQRLLTKARIEGVTMADLQARAVARRMANKARSSNSVDDILNRLQKRFGSAGTAGRYAAD